MYGMLLESVEHFLRREFGDKTWNEIRVRAKIKNRIFVTHERYPDQLILDIANAAACVVGNETGKTPEDFVQFFGVCFVKFFSNYGYDRIISLSGRNFRDFLSGIDNLHEHMRFAYPKLQSPSFYCSEETGFGLRLHYKSKRVGFLRYVMGQVIEVAKSFYDITLEMSVLAYKESEMGCNAVYQLRFDNSAFKPPSPDALSLKESRELSCDTFFSVLPFSFIISSNMTIHTAGDALTKTLGSLLIGSRVDAIFSLRRPRREFTWENIKTWYVVCELVAKSPRFMNYSKRQTLRHTKSVEKIAWFQQQTKKIENLNGELTTSKAQVYKDEDHFIGQRERIAEHGPRNHFPVQPEKIRRHSELGRNGVLMPSICKNDHSTKLVKPLHLRGHMKYLKRNDMVLFVCSPMIGSVDEMARAGLYMSDLGMHDSSQEMVLSGIQPLPQLEYARDQLLERGKTLEENLEKLEQERKRSEELLYRLMPKAVADRLKDGQRAVETCEFFDNVTIMFCYLDGFANICTDVTPMQAVSLVNTMFTSFDKLSEKHDVYKFETLGDAQYMVVSGLPVRKDRHAEHVAGMALDILNSARDLIDPSTGKPLTVTVGMHSGAVVAGLVGQKMPQYCLFGDSVNIAARLRTTSLPMRIHISESCKECLRGTEFETEFRGVIELKGRGKTKTFWLMGRKAKAQTSPVCSPDR